MLVLGVDVESTGLVAETDRVTEVGACLWDTNTGTPVVLFCTYVHDASFPKLSPFITDLTGITDQHLEQHGRPPAEVFGGLLELFGHAQAIVAHNAPFDRGFLKAELARLGVEMPATPWLDTSADIDYPEKIQTRKLVHLAAEHGLLNPFAHRALFDVMTMLNVLSHYDINTVVRNAAEPRYEVVASTEKPWEDGGKSTDKAKARGYRWNGAAKQWVKVVRKSQLEKEQSHGEFPVTARERSA